MVEFSRYYRTFWDSSGFQRLWPFACCSVQLLEQPLVHISLCIRCLHLALWKTVYIECLVFQRQHGSGQFQSKYHRQMNGGLLLHGTFWRLCHLMMIFLENIENLETQQGFHCIWQFIPQAGMHGADPNRHASDFQLCSATLLPWSGLEIKHQHFRRSLHYFSGDFPPLKQLC